MTFFNKKQDVIDFQLTPEGRRQLANGILKPVYYEFYDDDILYDIGYANATVEEQNSIQTRIKSNTPSFKGNARFIGAEGISGSGLTKFNSSGNKVLEDDSPNQYLFDNVYFTPLGTFDSLQQKAPYFDMSVLNIKPNGLTASAYQPLSGSAQKIPQLAVTCSYRYWHLDKGVENVVYRLNDPLVILLKERNVPIKDFVNNFEIQVFEMTENKPLPPKKFILEDKHVAKTFAQKSEETLKILKLNQEVTNRISEQLIVLLDEVYENSFGVKFDQNLFKKGQAVDMGLGSLFGGGAGDKGSVECKDEEQ